MRGARFFLFVFLLASIFFQSAWCYDTGLVISEIYADGSDEWIEIINRGPDHVSGNFVLSGVKATPVTIPIDLASGAVMIVGDTVPGVFDASCVAQTGLGLVINDFSSFRVELLSGAEIVDIFTSPAFSQTRVSVERFVSGTGLDVGLTVSGSVRNSDFHMRTSPCFSDLLSGSSRFPRESWTQSTIASGLIISEVLRDGSYEYVEIVNLGPTNYAGPVTIGGLDINPRTFFLNIPAYQVRVIAHPTLHPDFASGVVFQGEPLFQKINDQQKIALTLYRGSVRDTGALLDTVFLDQSLMQSFDNQSRSWERIRSVTGWSMVIVNDARITGRNWGIQKANPGYVYDDANVIIFPQFAPPPPLICDQGIVIDEIHRNDGYVDDYIEIVATQVLSGGIEVTGGGWTGTRSGTISSGQRLIFGRQMLVDQWYTSVSGLDTFGTLSIFFNGVMVDQVIGGSGSSTGQSLYASTSGCGRIFDSLAPSTPFFARSLFPLNPRTEVIITQTVSIGSSGSPPSCPVCDICSQGGGGTGTTSTGGVSTGVNIPPFLSSLFSPILTNIVYDPPGSDTNNERITLTNTLPYPIALSGMRLTYDTISPKTYQFKTGILGPYESKEIIDNFLFVNSRPVCVNMHGLTGLIHNTLCYDPAIHTGSVSSGPILSGGGDIPLFIDIVSLVYDSSPQSITVLPRSGGSDSSFHDLRIRINTGSQLFSLGSGTIMYGQQKIFSGEFSFPDDVVTIVSLLMLSGSQEIVLDTFSYDPRIIPDPGGDDNIFTGSVTNTGQLVVRFRDVVRDTPPNGFQSVILSLYAGTNALNLSTLRLRVNDNATRLTLTGGVLLPGIDQIITKNFRFPKTRQTTLRLLLLSGSQEIVLDTFSYGPTPPPSDDDDEDTDDPGIDPSGLVFAIKSIIYDPPGSDTNSERIDIDYLEGPIDLPTKDFRLRVNGTNKTLEGSFVRGTNTFVKTFGFPNTTKTCVDLVHIPSQKIYDTLCYDPGAGDDETSSGSLLSGESMAAIRITSLMYDPEGADTDRERIGLFYRSGETETIDLANYSLLINGKKRSFRHAGTLERQKEREIIGSFDFPNSVETCVSLLYQTHVLDTRCYDPSSDREEEKVRDEIKTLAGFALLRIDALMPNALGKDDAEEIHLRLLSGTLPLDLSPYFLLTDSNKKITLRGTMTNELIILRGSFGLPNSATCVSLYHKSSPSRAISRLCYPDPKEGILYDGTYQSQPTAQQSIYRLSYSQGMLCLYVSGKKTECFDTVLDDYHRLRLARQYITSLQSDMIYNYPTLRFYTSLLPLSVMYRDHVSMIDRKIYTRTTRGLTLPVSSLADHYDIWYGQKMTPIITDGYKKLFQ